MFEWIGETRLESGEHVFGELCTTPPHHLV